MSYPTKKLWEICDLYQPKTISKKEMVDSWKYHVFWANWIIWKYNNYNHEKKELLITCRWATCWSINISEEFSWINWNAMVSHIKDDTLVCFNFLYYAFKNIDFSKVISGSAQPQITRWWLLDLDIPLPPLPTQKLIVQKLDSSFEKIDKSIELTKKSLESLKELNKSVLDNIFKDWKFDKVILKDLLDICEYWSSEKSFDFLDDWIPILRMWNIQNWWIDFNWIKYADKNSKTLPKLFLKNEDLLFNRTNSWELVWKTGIYTWYNNEYTFAWYLIRLRFDNNKVIQKFWNYYFNSQLFRKTQIEPQIDQQCWQANFSWWKLKETIFLLPPLSKQKEIVSYLDKVFEKNKMLKEKYEKKLKDLEEMKQSILKEAFEWRLVKE